MGDLRNLESTIRNLEFELSELQKGKKCCHIRALTCPDPHGQCYDCPIETMAINMRLYQEENKQLEESLEWYADMKNYKPQKVYYNKPDMRMFTTVKPIDRDKGERARKALKGGAA